MADDFRDPIHLISSVRTFTGACLLATRFHRVLGGRGERTISSPLEHTAPLLHTGPTLGAP